MARSRPRGGTLFTTSPAMRMVPELMLSRPAIERSSVDLPQPDGPTSATNWPFGIERLTSRSAW